jgi:ABC-type nickel/cobalt efflux system permease component RcnA
MWKSAGRAPSLRVFTLAFALQLRKKHGKTTVRVRQTSVKLIKTSVRVQYTYYQDIHTLQNRHKHTHYKTHTHTHHTHTHHTHTHTHHTPHTHTHTHITKQYKTTTVQIKTDEVQDLPK